MKPRRRSGHRVRSNELRENERQRDYLLDILRNQFDAILRYKCEQIEVAVYLMAYDCGVVSDLYGAESAVYVGIKKGLDDFVHLYPVESSRVEVGKAEELGRRSSAQVRSMIEAKGNLHPARNIRCPVQGGLF